jgi:hypothetical protein
MSRRSGSVGALGGNPQGDPAQLPISAQPQNARSSARHMAHRICSERFRHELIVADRALHGKHYFARVSTRSPFPSAGENPPHLDRMAKGTPDRTVPWREKRSRAAPTTG